MAKKIKFPLDMGNEIMVRNIEELKEHYNSEKVVSYFLDGQLLTWLNDRWYEEEAEQISALAKDSDTSTLADKLAKIFGIEIESNIDVEIIAERSEKLNKLREYTSDDDILNNVDHVAFSQEELGDILNEGAEVIYLCGLCGDSFRIPLSKKGKKYVGINNPVVEIKTAEPINLDTYNILISKCRFSEKTSSMIFSTQQLIEKGLQHLEAEEFNDALDCFKQAADVGNHEGQFQYAKMYANGTGVEQDNELAKNLYLKAAENGSAKACNNLGIMYEEIEKYNEAFKWYERGAELGGSASALYNLGLTYISDEYEKNDPIKAEHYLCAAHDKGSKDATRTLAMFYADRDYENTFDPAKSKKMLDEMKKTAQSASEYVEIARIYSKYPDVHNQDKILTLFEDMKKTAESVDDYKEITYFCLNNMDIFDCETILDLLNLMENKLAANDTKYIEDIIIAYQQLGTYDFEHLYSVVLKMKEQNDPESEHYIPNCMKLGDALYKIGRTDEAIEEYTKAAEWNTTEAVSKLIEHYKQTGDDDKRIEWMIHYTEHIADNDVYFIEIGKYYLNKSKADDIALDEEQSSVAISKAMVYLDKAADPPWNNVKALEMLGDIFKESLNDPGAAEGCYRSCVEQYKLQNIANGTDYKRVCQKHKQLTQPQEDDLAARISNITSNISDGAIKALEKVRDNYDSEKVTSFIRNNKLFSKLNNIYTEKKNKN